MVLRIRNPARANVRHQAGVMNRTEERYAELLQARKAAGEIADWWFEAVTLRLANRTGFTPDFMVQLPNGTLELHEVKGFWREDARVKIKVAAALFPFRFVAVRWEKKAWVMEEF